MRSNLVNVRRRVQIDSQHQNRQRIYRGALAEDYDGLGQTVMVTFSLNSSSVMLRAGITPADASTGVHIPAGTVVTLYVNRGVVSVITMGYR